ncbi:MAG TPA: crotonase/enoyl-CoA hydratase family protein [Magnetospirillum sp.]|nr:crotonase/enoyl-CoA hydratase family protein [Magnetospirillum sp.]
MSEVVLCSIADGIAVFTLNRPDKLNALSFEVVDTLQALLDTVERDPEVNAVIITGSGRAFSAGADIAGFGPVVAQGTQAALREFVRRGQRLTARLESFPKPIIAAVNGLAFGGGCEITEAMHLAVASEEASFAKPEIILGFPPPFGGTQRLPRLVGRKRGLEMLLTGDPISAKRAEEIGLVNRVVPHAELLDAAKALARRIMEKSPLAVAATLGAVCRGLNVPIDEGLAIEATHFGLCVPTEDIREGIAAFLEKRPPHFVGR